ncbi:MAG: hypothetical protein HOP28_16855 [Gemmatimonadales bacterium]|nr:hypothetical protein [Gemmatimonadales bacterium]
MSEHENYRALGDTPWTLEGLGNALAHAATLHHTPRDDWDRRRRAFVVEDTAGTEREFGLNLDRIQTQLGLWLAQQLREQGVDNSTCQCHMWRLFEAIDFLLNHQDRLKEAGLIRPLADDPDGVEISPSLVAVLATAPYEGARLQGGDPVPTFHVDRVIIVACEEEGAEGNLD